MGVTEEEEFASFLKNEDTSISTSKDIDEKRSEDDSEEDEFAQFLKGSEDLKKAPATLTTEKTEEEPVVAQNNQDALPLEAPIAKEEQAHSLLSALPSQESGLDSQSKDAEEEELLRAMNVTFREDSKLPSDAIDTSVPLDAQEREITDKHNVLEVYKENYERDKLNAVTRKLTEQLPAFRDDLPNYIKTNKNRIAKGLEDGSGVKEEYSFEKKMVEISSPESVKSSILTSGVDNNIRVKMQALKTPEDKSEYKTNLISQIKDDYRFIGKSLTSGQERSLTHDSMDDLAIEASGLRKVVDQYFEVQTERKKFLDKKFGKIDQENDALREQLLLEGEDELSPEKKEFTQSLIKNNEFLKDNFINPNGKKTADHIMTGAKSSPTLYKNIIEQLPKDLSDKEKFDMLYISLSDAAEKSAKEAGIGQEHGVARTFNLVVREALGFDEIPLTGVPIPEGILSLTDTEKDAYELAGMVNDLTPIFLNNSIYKGDAGDEGFFTDLMNGITDNAVNFKRSFGSSIVPQASRAEGKSSASQSREDLINTLEDTGVSGSESANKEQLESYIENVLSPKGVTTEKVVETFGVSLAYATELLVGSGELKAATKLSKALSGKKATAYADKFIKALESKKLGKGLVKSVKAGAQAEASSQGRGGKEELKDELEFKQFAIGTGAQLLLEGGLKKASALNFAYKLYSRLGVKAKAATDFTSKLFTSASGEITQESFEQIVQAYNQTDEGGTFLGNLRKMFPDVDSVTEFVTLTAIMGGGMRIGGSYSEVRTKLKEGGYDLSKADEIIAELDKDVKEAVEETSKDVPVEVVTDRSGEESKAVKETQEEVDTETETARETTEEAVEEAPVAEPIAEVEEEVTSEPIAVPEAEVVGETTEEAPIEKIQETETKTETGESVQAKETETVQTEEVVSETETAGETKTEAEKVKETKAEAKKAKAAKKLEDAKQSESRNNTLVDTVKEYNKKDATQKKGKEGKALIEKARKMSEDQGHTFEIKEDGSVSVTDTKGKKIKTQKEFAEKKDIPEVSSQDQAWAVNQVVKKGALGDGTGVKMTYQSDVSGDVGLESRDIKSGIAQIKKGNYTTDNARKVLAAMADSRKKGFFEVSTGSGRNVKYESVPIDETGTEADEHMSKESFTAEMLAKEEALKEAEKFEVAAAEFADRIRKLKIKRPGTLSAGTPISIAWDGAIEVIAQTIHRTGNVATAVAKAIAHIKDSDWYKKKLPADKKKALIDIEPGLKDAAETVKKEKIKDDKRREIEELESKRKNKEKGKTKAETLREELSQKDPARRNKISKHFKTILNNPTLPQETKDAFERYSDGKYETTTDKEDIAAAISAVSGFDEAGMLDELIDDVEANFTSWGPVGSFILEATMLYYGKLGAADDSNSISNRKIQLISKTAAILRTSGVLLSEDQVARLMKSSMDIISHIKDEIKDTRTSKLEVKSDPNDTKSNSREEQILEGMTDLEEAIKEIAKIATKDPKIQKAIEKAFGKGKPESKPKTRSEKHKAELKKEVNKRAKIIADVKKNMGKNFYSSFGVTPEGIEMIGDLAASYVRSGITSVKMLADKLRTVLKDEFDVDISDTDLEKVMTYTGKDGQTAKDLIELQKDMVSEVLKKKILKSLDGKETKSTKKAIDLIADSLFGKFKDTAPKSGVPVSKVDQRKKMIDLMLEKDFSAEQWEKAKTSIKEKLDGDLDSEKITQEEYDETMNKLDSFFGDKVKLPFSDKLVDKVIREDLKKNKKSISALVQEIYDGISSGKDVVGDISSDILKDSGLSDIEISELKEVIEERLQNMVSLSLSKKIALENKREQARQAKEAKKEQAKQDKEIENAPENKLAKKILKQLESKEKAKTADAVDVMIRNLFSKSREGLPEKAKNETESSYRKKLIEGMADQKFSKQVWEDSKTTVKNILDGKEAAGEMTGAEKGQILKDLDSYFEGKVGAPFAKKLVGDSIKEQLKSDKQKIQDIVNEHYSNREERGRSLAEKIMVNTDGLSEAESDNLAEIIQKQFAEMVRETAQRALTKSLGINPDGSVKVKDDATLDEIIKSINQGALNEDAYINAFGKRFNFPTMDEGHAKRLNKFVFDIMHLPKDSGALAKEIVDFSTYLDHLKMSNASLNDKIMHNLNDVFITNILGSLATDIRGTVGIFFTGPLSVLTETAKVSMWLALKNPKLLFAKFNKMYDEVDSKNGELKKTNALLYYWGRTLKDRKADKAGSMKDIFTQSFTSYEVGQENIFGSNKKKGILHQLVDTRFSDFENTWKGNTKRVIRAQAYIPVMLTKILAASDILYDSAMRPHLATTYAIKKMLIDGENMPKTPQEFYNKVAKATSSTLESEKAARLQAENELDLMKDKGVNTKNFNMERRVKEILWASMDKDVRQAAERKAKEGRLGHDPEGDVGMFSNWLNQRAKSGKWHSLIIKTLTTPFMKIPGNAINLAIDYTPIGILRAELGRRGIAYGLRTKKGEKARERARIGKGFKKPFKHSKRKGNKYTGEELMSDRTDMYIRAALGTAAGISVTLAAVGSLGKEDEDEDNTFQIMASGKDRFSDNAILEKGERRHGIKPYHFRFKYPGSNTWSPWIDYTDLPFAIGFTIAGKISDDMVYKEKSDLYSMTEDEIRDRAIDPDMLAMASWEAVVAFKEKSYLQSINELLSLGNLNDRSGPNIVLSKFTDWATRPIRGTVYPQFYNNTWKSVMAATGANKKKVTSNRESIFFNYLEKSIGNTPFSLLLEDKLNNAGETEQLGLGKIPFASLVPGLETGAPLKASDELMLNRDKLNKSSLFVSPLVNLEVENEEGEPLNLGEREQYEKEYKQNLESFIIKNFSTLRGETDDEFVTSMEAGRADAKAKVLQDNVQWSKPMD